MAARARHLLRPTCDRAVRNFSNSPPTSAGAQSEPNSTPVECWPLSLHTSSDLTQAALVGGNHLFAFIAATWPPAIRAA